MVPAFHRGLEADAKAFGTEGQPGSPTSCAAGRMCGVTLMLTEEIAEASAFVALLSIGWVALGRETLRRWQGERRAHVRARKAEVAAADASFESMAFDPEVIRASVIEILTLAKAIDRDPPGLAARPDNEIIKHWMRDHQAYLARGFDSPPQIDLLHVVNRGIEGEDRVVLRVRLSPQPRQSRPARTSSNIVMDERWTLARVADAWALVEFDATPVADELVNRPLIPGAWADETRLRELSLTELALQDLEHLTPSSDLVTTATSDVVQQLLDMSVIDGRYLPALVEAQLLNLIEAWEQATNGLTDPLFQRVNYTAREQLLYPRADGKRTKLQLRDAKLKRWKPEKITNGRNFAHIQLSVSVSTVRHLVDPLTGEQLWGSTEDPKAMELSWRLGLTSSDHVPWQLVYSSNPAAGIPGLAPHSVYWRP